MGRRIDRRNSSILIAVVAGLLLVAFAYVAGTAMGGGRSQSTSSRSSAAVTASHAGAGDYTEPTDTVASDKTTPQPSRSTESIAEDAEKGVAENQEKEDVVDLRKLPAGTVVSDEQIAQAGGPDSFFWSEPIPDDVFSRMEGKSYGADCTVPLDDLRYVRVLHTTAEGDRTVGELVVNRTVAEEVVDIFRQLYHAGYPIHKMHLVDDYNADDNASISDDNTSAFNFRLIAGTNMISNHAYGLAIDINPFENPYIDRSGSVVPSEAESYADRSLQEPYVLHTDDLCFQLFTSHGWSWGGYWSSPIDYQHFEKV